ncbi:M23 family metallopeptidase [Demequina activiva]|uniref:Metalloendopeptidase n=1 Tax=Demequina activiva TaxID=1582364 RepID=A0A919Q1E4_9MICO|nr:M23 family metallopeptidase [Demequina activiva]GIG53492.1 metalloendopeptidase [Demequina activiva]
MTHTRRLAAIVAAILVVAVMGGYAVGTAAALGDASLPGSVRADDIDDLGDEIDGYQDQIDQTQAERDAAQRRADELSHALENTDARIVEADAKLRDLNEQLPALQEALEIANQKVEAAVVQQGIVADKLAAAEAQDQAISDQIAADEERTADLEALVAAIARETYKGDDATASLDIVFGATDARSFVDEYTAQQSASRVQSNTLAELDEIAAVNRNRGTRQEAVREYIAELKIEADALVVELEGLRDIAQEKKDDVQALLDRQEELRQYLESQRATFLAQQEENERLQQQLRNRVLDLVQKKADSEEALKAAREAAAQQGGKLNDGYLSFPTKVPYKTSSFGMRVHPIYGYARLHAGTDLRAYCGTPIYASASGTVQWATWQAGYGNQVLIDHGYVGGKSLITNYNHLSRFAVSSGQTVARGDLVGYSGNTGSSTACHLHFEVYVNGNVVDPESLLPSFP